MFENVHNKINRKDAKQVHCKTELLYRHLKSEEMLLKCFNNEMFKDLLKLCLPVHLAKMGVVVNALKNGFQLFCRTK